MVSREAGGLHDGVRSNVFCDNNNNDDDDDDDDDDEERRNRHCFAKAV